MDITEITANDVMLDLNPREHLALSRSFSMLMASLEPSDIRSTLGWSVEQAYELSYSVYVIEARARLSGNSWLEAPGCSDRVAVANGGRPVVSISFTGGGSSWRLTARQARFIGRCMDVARRMEAAGTLVENRDELVFDLAA